MVLDTTLEDESGLEVLWLCDSLEEFSLAGTGVNGDPEVPNTGK